MGAELFGGKKESAIHAGLAVELFHNFTLIHDDIMDEAPLRRGKETVHTRWNTNIGILSGDALMIEAYQCLARHEPEILAEILPLFNRTAIEVCEGQQMDMDFEERAVVSTDEYIQMIAYKTAVLLGCSLQMGAITAGASKNDAEDLYQFGLNLGIAFQIQDDILDVYADQNKFGKQVGGDIIANKKTYLLLQALKDADQGQMQRFETLLASKDNEMKVNGVMQLYAELNIHEKATAKKNEFHAIAMEKLAHIRVAEEQKKPLEVLAHFLLDREH
jgi:geranylgeranyl diphosphate synthase type II